MEGTSHTSLGHTLRAARLARGETLHDVAERTKISASCLHAMEDDRFDKLPGGLFNRAYIRAYADAVGLDRESLVREYRARCEPPAPASPLPAARPSLVQIGAPLLAAVLVVGTLVLWWSATPARVTVTDHQAARVVLDEATPDPVVPALLTEMPEMLTDSLAGIDGPSDGLRLEILTRRLCWVSAVADGDVVVRRLMHAGEHAVIDARQVINLSVGDAGALRYWINGQTGRAIGQEGDVVSVEIREENVRSFEMGDRPGDSAPA